MVLSSQTLLNPYIDKKLARDVAQLGRALASGARGRRFKSCRLDSLTTSRFLGNFDHQRVLWSWGETVLNLKTTTYWMFNPEGGCFFVVKIYN